MLAVQYPHAASHFENEMVSPVNMMIRQDASLADHLLSSMERSASAF
jgi:hypothetical protein